MPNNFDKLWAKILTLFIFKDTWVREVIVTVFKTCDRSGSKSIETIRLHNQCRCSPASLRVSRANGSFQSILCSWTETTSYPVGSLFENDTWNQQEADHHDGSASSTAKIDKLVLPTGNSNDSWSKFWPCSENLSAQRHDSTVEIGNGEIDAKSHTQTKFGENESNDAIFSPKLPQDYALMNWAKEAEPHRAQTHNFNLKQLNWLRVANQVTNCKFWLVPDFIESGLHWTAPKSVEFDRKCWGLWDKHRWYESNMSTSCCCCGNELDSTIALLNPGCSCCISVLCSNSLTAGSGSCLGASLNWWTGIWSLSSWLDLSYPPICNGGSGGRPRFRNMPWNMII